VVRCKKVLRRFWLQDVASRGRARMSRTRHRLVGR
jgi:hypothetical protein